MKLADSILAALRYSDKFNHPLTLQELSPRLVQCRASRRLLQQELDHLLRTRRLAKTGAFYHLPRRASLVPLRRRKEALAAPLLARATILAHRLASLPGVVAVYLTGSLAVGTATRSSDIDFMLITTSGRLWTTRLLATLYTSLLKLRRTPGSRRTSGLLCLNLYLTPASFTLPPAKQSLYSAYELLQAKPLVDPSHTYPHLLASNPWVRAYLPNFLPSRPHSPLPALPPSLPARLIEYICYHLERRYMRRRLTVEYITPSSAFFHPRLPRELK